MKMVKENIIPLSDGKGKLLTDDIQKAETFKPFSLPLSSHEKVVFDLITSIGPVFSISKTSRLKQNAFDFLDSYQRC